MSYDVIRICGVCVYVYTYDVAKRAKESSNVQQQKEHLQKSQAAKQTRFNITILYILRFFAIVTPPLLTIKKDSTKYHNIDSTSSTGGAGHEPLWAADPNCRSLWDSSLHPQWTAPEKTMAM